MSFSFDQLNLSNYEVSTSSVLKPGRHVCKIKSATPKDSRSGGKMIALEFDAVDGSGNIRNWINVHVPSSEKATRIGREELKTMLTYAGHANPNHPFANDVPVSSLAGLTVGVRVVSDTYIKDGEERTGSAVKGYFDPAEVGSSTASSPTASATPSEASSSTSTDMDDDIPF